MINFEEVYQYLNENEPKLANQICYASELLLSHIDEAIEVLRERRKQAVEIEDDVECDRLKNYRDMLKEYKKDINTYLNYATRKTQPVSNEKEDSPFIPGFESEIDITQDELYKNPTDYSRYNINSSKPHSLDEDFTHTKICAFMFRNKKYKVKSWQDAIVTLCNLLAKKSEKIFNTLISNPTFIKRKVSYFGYDKVNGRNALIKDTNIYVWTNLSANEIAKFISDLLISFGENPNDFYIYLRADFTERHYSNTDDVIINYDSKEKIGKHVQKCMRELEAKHYNFTHNELLVLLDAKKSKELFGITYPFFTDNKNKLYDKNGHIRFWKDPYKFNGKYYYITSQWFDHNREKFDAWFKGINRNVR